MKFPCHAIITGGSSGIGLALADLLWHRGWNLSLIARDTGKLTSAAASLGKRTDQICLTFSADVADSASMNRVIADSLITNGCPDILITSAGIAYPGYVEDLALTIHQQTMAINYFGTLHAINAVLPAMRQRGQGKIVMLSSAAALTGVFGYSAYAPSKCAVKGLASVLRSELKPDGIQVSVVFPPDTETPQLYQENLTKPVETFAIAGKVKAWKVEDVAKTILNGMDKNRFMITPGWETSVLARFGGLFDPVLNACFDRVIAKTQKLRQNT